MTEDGPLGRNSMSLRDKMLRYHGEIERLVYAAEQICNKNPKPNDWTLNIGCPTECPFFEGFAISVTEWQRCNLVRLREIFGDHVIQHDIPVVPPCQCGGDCNKQDKP